MLAENAPFTMLIDSFKKFFPLTSEEKNALLLKFTQRSIKRRGFVLQQGDICKHFTFVVSGCFKLFAVDKGGKEHNLQFAPENDWITDLASFYEEKPSCVYIEATEPSTILQITHEDLLELYINYHKFDRNFRIIIEKKYMALQDRVLQNISASAEERYEYFLQHYPHLANRLPNTQIASYLGITPEFLSKVRKDLTQKLGIKLF
jgi:CRP-like cAMP-binding protein